MKSGQKGFTLVEVTLAVAISVIIIFGVLGILQVSNRQMDIVHTKMTLQQGPREALFKMAQEIRQTAWHKIENFGEAGTDGIERTSLINFVVPVPNPSEATLVDSNYTPKWANNIQYKLDPNTHQILRLATDLATNSTKQAVLANEVISLEFSRPSNSPGLITITTTTQRQLPDGTQVPAEPIELSSQAEARNP